jgi:hypothetical protein
MVHWIGIQLKSERFAVNYSGAGSGLISSAIGCWPGACWRISV